MASSSSRRLPELIILSGATCAGKTSLSRELARDRFGLVEARAVIADRLSTSRLDRAELRAFGAQLERETSGEWLADAVRVALEGPPRVPQIVDSTRTGLQLAAVRSVNADGIVHVHLTASHEVREVRFRERQSSRPGDRQTSFEELARDPIEQEASGLQEVADVVIDTSASSADTVARAVREELAKLT